MPNATVNEVDSATKTIITAGLGNDPNAHWSVVNPLNYASTAHPYIFADLFV